MILKGCLSFRVYFGCAKFVAWRHAGEDKEGLYFEELGRHHSFLGESKSLSALPYFQDSLKFP